MCICLDFQCAHVWIFNTKPFYAIEKNAPTQRCKRAIARRLRAFMESTLGIKENKHYSDPSCLLSSTSHIGSLFMLVQKNNVFFFFFLNFFSLSLDNFHQT
jgi:hypothetical protein